MTIEIRSTTVFRGPNIWARMPAILMEVDIGELEERPTNKIPGFYEHLTELLPGLYEHSCSVGKPGGFLQRLREGTWMGHVLEHVALELQNLAGAEVTRGKTRGAGERGLYNVVYAYAQEDVGIAAGKLATRLLNHIIYRGHRAGLRLRRRAGREGHPAGGATRLRSLHRRHRFRGGAARYPRAAPGPTALLRPARPRAYQKRVWATVTSATADISVDVAGNKELTNRLLHEIGIPVPRADVVRSAGEAAEVARRIGYPVVLKPLDGNHGRA